MKLTNPKNGNVLESKYSTHAEAHAVLLARIIADEFPDSKFHESILAATEVVRGSQRGTAGQLYWLHKLANEGAKRAPEALAKYDLTKLVEMLSHAKGEGLKNPSIVLTTAEGVEVKLSIAGPKSRNEGAVTVASTSYTGPYYGRVMPDGAFFAGRDYKPEIGILLNSMVRDPQGFAKAQGKLTGRCCFCRKSLEDDKSVSLGYGPVCAKKFGLSHNAKAARFAKVKRGGQAELDFTKRGKVVKNPFGTSQEVKPRGAVRRVVRRNIDEA